MRLQLKTQNINQIHVSILPVIQVYRNILVRKYNLPTHRTEETLIILLHTLPNLEFSCSSLQWRNAFLHSVCESPQSFFLILPFLWSPRPKPDFLTSPTNLLFFLRPPLCRKCCFASFLRWCRIWSLDFSSERTLRPPGFCCAPTLWKFGLLPRPRPRPGRRIVKKRYITL